MKHFLQSIFYRIFLKSVRYAKTYRINELNKLASIRIDPTFDFEEGTNFVIEGTGTGLVIEKNVKCRKFCNFLIYPQAMLIIRSNVFFNNWCSINCLGNIEIGENSMFGEGVKIYDHNHAYSFNDKKLNIEREKFKIGTIKIGKNCWIGSNVIILNNVQIGDNVIIGANCLVYKSIPSNSIVKLDEKLIIRNAAIDF